MTTITRKKPRGAANTLARRDAWKGVAFAMPAILGFLIFTIGPMIASFVLSMTNYQIGRPLEVVGFENYRRMLSGDDIFFYKSLGVTFYYVALSVPVNIIFAFSIALLMNRRIVFRSVLRTIFYLPTVVPIVASSYIWLWLLNPDIGLVNSVLRSLHLPTSRWIFAESSVIPSLVFMNMWSTGNTMVIFLAGLQNIPDHLYESAELDGAGPLMRLVHVTLPMISPTLFYNLVMGLINGFQVFTRAYMMTQGGPNNASLFYLLLLYREAFTNSRMGYASALAWALFVIIIAFTAMMFKSSALWTYYEGGDAK